VTLLPRSGVSPKITLLHCTGFELPPSVAKDNTLDVAGYQFEPGRIRSKSNTSNN
jgi:hypothetical protein